MKKRFPPPLWFALCAGVMWSAAPRLPGVGIPAFARYAGVIILAVWALWLAIGALRAFARVHTTFDPRYPERASVLVTDGVFQQSRNPMYLAWVLLLCAQTVWLQSPFLFIGVVVFMRIITAWQIIPEEQALTARFPVQYPEYLKRVRRWL